MSETRFFFSMRDWAPSQILVFTKTAGLTTGGWRHCYLRSSATEYLNTLSTSLRPTLARPPLSRERRSRKIGPRNHTRYLSVFCHSFPCGMLWSQLVNIAFQLVKSISFHIPGDLKRNSFGFGTGLPIKAVMRSFPGFPWCQMLSCVCTMSNLTLHIAWLHEQTIPSPATKPGPTP